MHPAQKAKLNTLTQADRVSIATDVLVYLRFFLTVYTVGFAISFIGVFLILLPISVLLFAEPTSFWFLIEMWFFSIIIGLPFGLPVWLLCRVPLRVIGVPEIGSALLASIPTLLVGLHFSLTLADAQSFDLLYLMKLASSDVSQFAWLYLLGAVLAPFFAMRAINE